MSSTENNTQRARRDEQQTRFLSRENIVKMLKTTIVLSALFIADDGQHGHELHQYLRSSIRDQWMVWD